jgi:2-haloacid dehalogenase
MKPRAVVFDAYGTLFDVHSGVLREGHGITGDLRALSELWRQRQLEYAWLRSLMERYEDFRVTEAVLRSAVGQLQIQVSEAQVGDLMRAYLFPSAFPDVKPGLESLKGIPLAILSNGTPEMLESAVRHNALDSSFDEIISRVRTYKPSPRVYALGVETLRLRAAEMLFVSSNWWDVAGASSFGYMVCRCNRSNADIELLAGEPELTVARIDQIADLFLKFS